MGHILFSPIHIKKDQTQIPALALAPMAVLPDFQRRGIGTKLVRRGVEACCGLGHAIIVVVGHPHFYPRFGFKPARSHGIEAPFEVPDEAFMVLVLRQPQGRRDISGMVQYSAVFDEA